ncbi:MAG: hypothetical protein GEV12_09375 [Micromonosporaceae bacterium]|nr:hypothetical protein [Micromonosporaceae bacterium]
MFSASQVRESILPQSGRVTPGRAADAARPRRLRPGARRSRPEAREPRSATRLGRFTGRQLTRIGAVWQRLGLLPVAELSFRTAVRLSPDPGWLLRLGQIREARKRWAGAGTAYQHAIELTDGAPDRPRHHANASAHAHYRQARLRARQADWDGAEAAFSVALRLRPDKAVWHAHRAEVQESRQDWAAAADSYLRATELQTDQPGWTARLVQAYLKAGRPDLAIGAGAPAFGLGTAHVPGTAHPSLAPDLLLAYEEVGDWRAAAGMLRDQTAHRPRDHAARIRLVDSLEKLYLVPFRLDHTGLVADSPEQRRARASGALAEAIEQLRQLTADAPKRTGPPHRLGLLYERSGQLIEAAGAYRLAMDRLVTVDAWWCHRAAHEWAYRLAYVGERLAPSGSGKRRLLRSATPLGSDPPEPEPPQVAGFFDAVMFRHGLQMSGFLLPGAGQLVEIHLDDQLLTQVQVKSSGWRPALRYDLTHGLLNDFPESSRLTLRAGGRRLVTVGGAAALEIRVPGGNGAAARKLARGVAPTKKGSWPRIGGKLATRQERYLRVYERAKELLDQQDRRLFLCYGTLLGCHREDRFIPGDDDFDVSYVSRAADPAGFRRECQQVALELLRHGMDVNLSINGRLFKVGLNGVWIDVTPMWFYQGRAWAFDAHDLTVDDVEPVQVAEFAGRRVYLPRDPDAFLADAYGPDWRTPQPEFRYYRSKADDRILSQMWAKPSEVRGFARLADAERAGNPAAGTFVGVGYPGYPGFSWLTAPDGPRTPPPPPGTPPPPTPPPPTSTPTGSGRC